MTMKAFKDRFPGDMILIMLYKIVLAVGGGIAVGLFPVLRHWVIYILWGPCLAIAFVWAYSATRDIDSEDSKWQCDLKRGLAVGSVHFVAVSFVWKFVMQIFNS